MLADLIRNLNKIKKKHGDIQVFYVYSKNDEMTLANITKVAVAYTKLDTDGVSIISHSVIDDDTFITEKEYKLKEDEAYHPVILLSEEINT